MERRLTYKTLISEKVKTVKDIPVRIANHNPNSKPVIQLKYGEIIGTYQSINEAATLTGINLSNISKTLQGKRSNAGGFKWIYA